MTQRRLYTIFDLSLERSPSILYLSLPMVVLLSLLASAVWSLNPVLLARALRKEHPVGIHVFRIASIAVVLLPYVLWRGSVPDNPVIWLLLLGAALAGPVFAWLFYILALKHLPISIAHPLVNSFALFAIGFEILIWGIIPPLPAWVGVFLILLGMALFQQETRAESGPHRSMTVAGLFFALATSFLWGIGSALFKALVVRMDIYTLLFYRSAIATVLLSPFLFRFPLRTWEGRLLASLSGILNDVGGLWLYLTAIRHAPLYLVVPLSSLSPVLAYFWARAWFAEAFRTRRWLAILAIVVGTVLLSRTRG